MAIMYTKEQVEEIRKGIVIGENITDEQEEVLQYFNIAIPLVEEGRGRAARLAYVHAEIEKILLTMKKKKHVHKH